MFQVIGSTPVSIKEELVNSGLEGDSAAGAQLASICLLASATVKRVVEEVLIKNEFSEARKVVNKSLSLNGKVNMSALTLIGHCLLTTSIVDDVHFAKASRTRLGQRHLWDGELNSGQLSEKQTKIMKERRGNISVRDATLLGSGFFKFFSMSRLPYTVEEAEFWGIRVTGTESNPVPGPSSSSSSPPNPMFTQEARPTRRPPVPPPAEPRPGSIHIPETSTSVIPARVAEYCRVALNWNDARITQEAERQGVARFVSQIETALIKDPEMKGARGKSVVS